MYRLMTTCVLFPPIFDCRTIFLSISEITEFFSFLFHVRLHNSPSSCEMLCHSFVSIAEYILVVRWPSLPAFACFFGRQSVVFEVHRPVLIRSLTSPGIYYFQNYLILTVFQSEAFWSLICCL